MRTVSQPSQADNNTPRTTDSDDDSEFYDSDDDSDVEGDDATDEDNITDGEGGGSGHTNSISSAISSFERFFLSCHVCVTNDYIVLFRFIHDVRWLILLTMNALHQRDNRRKARNDDNF